MKKSKEKVYEKGEKVEKDKKQHIKCDVHSCEYCDCSDDVCELREIEIKKQCGCDCATKKDETICSSYKTKKDIK